MHKEAFELGYMNKEGASIGGVMSNVITGGAEVSMHILDRLRTAALVAPLFAGATAGVAHSMITSPGKEDIQLTGKKLVNAELQQSLARMTSMRQHSMNKDKEEKKRGKEREVYFA